jgi:hypothetical protein
VALKETLALAVNNQHLGILVNDHTESQQTRMVLDFVQTCANNYATMVPDQLVVRSKETMPDSEEEEQWRNVLALLGTAVIITGSLLQHISTPEYPAPFSRTLTPSP